MIRLLELQSEMLRQIATGHDLAAVAETLCRRAERLAGGVACSIMMVDESGNLHPLAAPSLPQDYTDALQGVESGPKAGSCGTATFLGHEVIVTDIANDPLWEAYSAQALSFGLKACWSSPILAEDGRVVATFAFYYQKCRGPSEMERRIVATCVDLCSIAIRHHEALDRMRRLAFVDSMTGLPNRTACEQFIREALGDGDRPVAVHYIDVDEFKLVNDTLGHRTGNLLLTEIGNRLKEAVGPDVFLSRLGADEFVLCLNQNDSETQKTVAEAVLTALAEPLTIMGHALSVTASIGVALSSGNAETLEGLAQKADIALYRAKAAGRNTYRLFSGDMAEELHERHRLKADLRRAIDEDGFHIVYQPILNMQTHALSCFEALLRWHHPELGPIGPDRFIPLAEESGLIGEIGLWVLRWATREAYSWPSDISLAVNVSPLQLKQPNFAFDVVKALRDSGLPASRLILEVTETALFDNDAVTRQTLSELKALGISIALDDFGTGYSSLSLIRDRRFRQLKIDKSFVDGIGSCRDSEAIVRGTIEIARQMGFRIVAEGIEHVSQLLWLEAHGCDEAQGYYISRPMRAQDIAGFVHSNEASKATRRAAG